ALPGTADSVTIDNLGNPTVVVNGDLPAVGSLDNRAVLRIAGNTSRGFGRLTVAQDLVNHGIIQLTTTANNSGNKNAYLTSTGGTLTNAADGRIEALAGQGDDRFLTGNLTNLGTIFVESSATLSINGGIFSQQAGSVNGTGQLVQSGGAFTFTGGTLT